MSVGFLVDHVPKTNSSVFPRPRSRMFPLTPHSVHPDIWSALVTSVYLGLDQMSSLLPVLSLSHCHLCLEYYKSANSSLFSLPCPALPSPQSILNRTTRGTCCNVSSTCLWCYPLPQSISPGCHLPRGWGDGLTDFLCLWLHCPSRLRTGPLGTHPKPPWPPLWALPLCVPDSPPSYRSHFWVTQMGNFHPLLTFQIFLLDFFVLPLTTI